MPKCKLIGSDPNQYLTVYDVEVDDPAAFLAVVGEGAATGKSTSGTTSNDATTYTAFFAECDEPVVAEA